MDKPSLRRIVVELKRSDLAGNLDEKVQKSYPGLSIQDAFPKSEPNEKARKRAELRGTGKKVDLSCFKVVIPEQEEVNLSSICDRLLEEEEVFKAFVEELPQPVYNPNDPAGLDFALTDQQLTHPNGQSALDLSTGSSITIGMVEMPVHNAGADYTRPELGGTGNRAADWAAIQAGTHSKFVVFTDSAGNAIDPFGTGHGDRTVPRCVGIADNNIRYLGTAPGAKMMFAFRNGIGAAIMRLADLGVDVITISYTGSWGRRTAAQYAISNGVVVVDAHANNTNAETRLPKPYEAITVGGYNQRDYSTARSWGIGLTMLATSTYGTTFESYATPTVAGAAALLLDLNPTWNPYDVHRALIQSAFKPPQMGANVFTRTHGWGLLRIYDALQLNLADLLPLPPVDVELTQHRGRVLEITWTNRPITNFDGVRIVGSRNRPPTAGTGNELQRNFPVGRTSGFIVPPASGNWHFAILAKDTSGRFSEAVEYVQLSVDYYIYRCPKAPGVDTVASPTTVGMVTLTGTKERRTAIHIHGREVVPLDNRETWSATVTLDLGGNLIPVTAVDEYGESSDPAYAYVDRQMYVRLAGDTMTGPLQLDNAGTDGGLRLRKNQSGDPEWALKTSGEDLVFVEPDDNDKEVLRVKDIFDENSPAIQLGALAGASLSANQLEALTKLLGSNTTFRVLNADNNTVVERVSFPSPRNVTAFIAMTSSDPRHDHDRGDMYGADIFRVDGAQNPGRTWFGGDHLGANGSNTNLRSPFFQGIASDIDFRLRSFEDSSVWAVAVVMSDS